MKPRTIPTPLLLTIIGLGAFVTALDQTVVVTALPEVMLDLKIPVSELDRASWIVTAYLLGYTSAMPLIGRLADVYGQPRVYQASLVVFSVGTCLVAVSSNLEWMVGARIVQAIGGGATVPIGLAIASTAFPQRQRGMALGIVVAAAEAGSMLGPAYGGAIIELLDWRWIFWLNVPQSAVLFLALMWLTNQPQKGVRVDYLGGVMLTAALVVISLALSRQGLFTLSSPVPFIIGVPGLAIAAALILFERRVSNGWYPSMAVVYNVLRRRGPPERSRGEPGENQDAVGPPDRASVEPLLSPFISRSWVFITANATQLLEGVSFIIAMVTVPLMAGTVMGKEPLTGAWWLLRMTAAIPVGAVVGGYLSGIIGIRPVITAGLGLSALGLFLVSTWELDIGEPWLTLHLVTAGLGFGLNNAPIMTRALNSVSEEYRSTAASLVTVSRMVGMALGLAALSAWGVERFQLLTAGLELPIPIPGETASALQARVAEYNAQLNDAGLTLFHNFFRVAGGVALAAIIPALAMWPSQREREERG